MAYTDEQIELAHKIMDELQFEKGDDAIAALKYALLQTEEAVKDYKRTMGNYWIR